MYFTCSRGGKFYKRKLLNFLIFSVDLVLQKKKKKPSFYAIMFIILFFHSLLISLLWSFFFLRVKFSDFLVSIVSSVFDKLCLQGFIRTMVFLWFPAMVD